MSLAARYARSGMNILDPFCGTGRLLFAAAADFEARCIGLDINPLACLLTEAKAAKPSIARLQELLREARTCPSLSATALTLRGTKVQWLSDRVASELGEIVAWLNKSQLSRDELVVVAACLSATTRETAWIRKSGWKLHRMDSASRSKHSLSPWVRFAVKLSQYIKRERETKLSGVVSIEYADAADVQTVLDGQQNIDLIITSPPYGDSRTTVQYGAASGICLDVVSRLHGLEDAFVAGGLIDRSCLGGTRTRNEARFRLRDYWSGAADSEPAKRASSFLQDYSQVLTECYSVLKPGGSFVVIVGRRSLGGYRLRLDDFTRDTLSKLGCILEKSYKRQLKQKSVPRKINRFGRAGDTNIQRGGLTVTMDDEIILVLQKNAQVGKMVA
ncbi:DNA methyltransferase [Sphingobium yanoikuyae]